MTSKAFGLAQLGNAYADGALSNRNLIINGAMQVWQRGTSVNAGVDAFQYAADRFWIYAPNGSGSLGQSTDAPSGFAYSTHNNSNSQCSFGSNVELTRQGFAAPFALNQFITLSFFVKGASAGSGTVDFSYRDVSTGAGTVVIASAQNRGFSYTTEWSRVTIPVQIDVNPGANNRMLQAEFGMPAGMRVTGVQLEAGDTATPFEHRSYGQELALCQRYTLVLNSNDSNLANRMGFGMASNVTNAFCQIRHPVTMRAKPSLTTVIAAGQTINLSDTAAATATTSLVVQGITTDVNQTQIDATVASGLTALRSYYLEFGGAGSTLTLSAEL